MAGVRGDTALVVVDVQNDFVVRPSAGAKPDPERLLSVAANTAQAVEAARDLGVEVVFVRFLGDPRYQGASWQRRNQTLGKKDTCLQGTPGADFHSVRPLPDELVISKKACFDAFLEPELEDHLRQHGITHLAFAGLYTDVCVDSTARTAFQKGFHISVLTDCTAALHLAEADIHRFMVQVYGARLLLREQSAAWSGAPRAEAS